MRDKKITPYRSIRSFGCAGLLKEDAYIFYHQMFNSLHLGMVTDLIMARVRSAGLDELSLRAISVIGFFEAYRDAIETQNLSGELIPHLKEPITLECGIDDEKIALIVRFQSPRLMKEATAASVKMNIEASRPETHFGVFIKSLELFSDQLIIKKHPESYSIEIASVVALDYPAESEGAKPFEENYSYLEIIGNLEETPRAKNIQELGDLDYTAMLTANREHKISSDAIADEGNMRVSGGDKITDDVSKVRAWNEEDKAGWGVGGGSGENDGNGLGADAEKALAVLHEKLEKAQAEIKELKKQKGMGKGGGLFGALKKSFSKEEEPVDPNRVGKVQLREIEKIVQEEHNEARKDNPLVSPDDLMDALEEIVRSIQIKSFYEVTKKNFELSEQYDEKIDSAGLRGWLNGFIRDLMKARFEMIDLTLDFQKKMKDGGSVSKSADKSLRDEIKKKDEVIRHKSNAITNLKEQIAQLNLNSERLKSQNLSAMSDAQFKSKYQQACKQISAAKDDVSKMRKRIDELTGQLAQAKANANKGDDKLLLRLKEQTVKDKKQIETFRRQAQDAVGQARKFEMQVQPMERQLKDAKDKIQKMSRVVESTKKDTDAGKARTLQLEREIQKLKMELEQSKKKAA